MCKSVSGKCFVYLCTITACLSSILLGYDIGVMSGAIVYMERDLALTAWGEEVIIASFSFFSVIGALIGGQLAASFGRKKTIAISALLFFIGSIIMVITRIFAIILFGRILLGIASGLGLLIAPLYTAELSPPSMRGKLVALSEISINTGILFGYFIAFLFYFMHDDQAWRIMILFGCIPSILLFIGMLIMPESPRWLVEHGKLVKARQVLTRIHVDEDLKKSEIEEKIKDIQKTIALEQREGKATWGEVLLPCIYKPSLILRKALIIGCGIAFFQQATGIDAVVYYTPITFEDLGLDEQMVLLCTTFMGVSKLFFIFVAMALMDRVGRRKLLLISSVLLTISLFGLMISFLIGRPAGFTVFLQCFYVSSFSIGWGPCCWVMISEIFPLQIRSRGMAVSTCMNRLTAGIVALFFLSLKQLITPIGIWILFGCISIFATIYVYKFVPETKNKTLEQITNSLVHGVGHLKIPDTENISELEDELRKDVIGHDDDVSNDDSNGKLEMVNFGK